LELAHAEGADALNVALFAAHEHTLKRLLIHAGGFNLGLVMRHAIGVGTPRGLRAAWRPFLRCSSRSWGASGIA
jgi:transposase